MAELRENSVVDVEMQDAEAIPIAIDASQESQGSEEYGDENAVPVEHDVVSVPQSPSEDRTITCTPARVFYAQPREICTVSKVPLRPAGEESPLKMPRKRSRSIAGPLASAEPVRRQPATPVKDERRSKPTSPVKPRSSNDDSLIETPRTLRKSGSSEVLKGAVVYVDVHTTEGEDASGIFLELLTQMGARCVKQWSWNPRGSIAGFADGEHSPTQSDAINSKIGITHVVFKDGGKRTMEKVRESRGAVFCVGVGWVLDCERENKWLDEADYAIDTSLVPRGGHRRRKSMEPRMLANMNGNLVPAETPAKQTPDFSPTKEFLTFSTPASRRDSFSIDPHAPATPVIEVTDENLGGSPLSPTTPYYLSKGAQLVQQTCPPKQSQELLFPISGRIEDQPDEGVRQRLLVARRKSLQWVPKVSSPLGRAVSYGK